MVIVSDFAVRKNAQGESFVALLLSGSVELIKSAAGKVYATCRKTSVPSTLDEQTARAMVGTRLSGSIIKVPSDPYMFKLSDGTEVELNYRWEYSDSTVSEEEKLFS